MLGSYEFGGCFVPGVQVANADNTEGSTNAKAWGLAACPPVKRLVYEARDSWTRPRLAHIPTGAEEQREDCFEGTLSA